MTHLLHLSLDFNMVFKGFLGNFVFVADLAYCMNGF